MNRPHPYPGLYIAFEGIIGTGKSTQIRHLADVIEQALNLSPVVTCEPGGTPLAEDIREMVTRLKLQPWQEATLFAEARKETLTKVVVPALAEGKIVISDRTIFSNLAYQGRGRRLGIRQVWDMNLETVGKDNLVLPDLVIFIDVGIESALNRSGKKDVDEFDRESKAFWERTRRGFGRAFELVLQWRPGFEVKTIKDLNGELSIGGTHQEIQKVVFPVIGDWTRSKEGRVAVERQRAGKERV